MSPINGGFRSKVNRDKDAPAAFNTGLEPNFHCTWFCVSDFIDRVLLC